MSPVVANGEPLGVSLRCAAIPIAAVAADVVVGARFWPLVPPFFLVLVLSETVLVLVKMMMFQDVLISFDAFDAETNQVGKFALKRIVTMLTRLIQRIENVAKGPIEYEYREAEYEYEEILNKALD